MTIARPSSGTTPPGEGFDDLGVRADCAPGAAVDDGPVPESIRSERLAAQVAQFARAGYRVEQRSSLQAVVVKERERPIRSRVLQAARTLGVVPLLIRAPRAYHRVLITIDADGSVRVL